MSTKTKLTLSFLLPNQSFSKRERKRSVQEYGDDAKNGYLQFVKKILEKLIFDKMFQIFIENKQIATNQFGFKPGDSCIKACFCYFLSIFCFSTKCQPFQNYEQFFISTKKLFSFWRYSYFCNFFPSFPNFPDKKTDKWKWNNL